MFNLLENPGSEYMPQKHRGRDPDVMMAAFFLNQEVGEVIEEIRRKERLIFIDPWRRNLNYNQESAPL